MSARNPSDNVQDARVALRRIDERLDRLEKALVRLESPGLIHEPSPKSAATENLPVTPAEGLDHEVAERLTSLERDIAEIKEIVKNLSPEVSVGKQDELALADLMFEKQRVPYHDDWHSRFSLFGTAIWIL